MPKVSSNPADARHVSAKAQDGWKEVVGSPRSLIYQFPPTREAKGTTPAGTQFPPALFVELMCQPLVSPDGPAAPGMEPEQVLLAVARVDKASGELSDVWPGNYPDGDLTAEVVSCGNTLGSAGNTFFAAQDGFQFSDSAGYIKFCQSLHKLGFKPTILERSYLPDFTGMVFLLQNVVEKGSSVEFDSNRVLAKEIRKFPYEGKAKPSAAGGRAKPAAAQTAPAAATPAAPSAPAAAGSAADDLSAESLAERVVAKAAETSKGVTIAPPEGEIEPNFGKLKVTVLMAINKVKPAIPANLKKAVQDKLSDLDWLTAYGEANGLFNIDMETGVIQFS